MPAEEQPVYRYGDFPELFWDLQRDKKVDGTNPSIIARLLEHAPAETIWKLVPVEVLLRDFEKLTLPEHTRRFWSIVVGMMREERGMDAPALARDQRGITYRARPRFHPGSDRPRPVPQRETYRYGDLPELFWDLPADEVVDGADPEIIARVLESAPPALVWRLVPADALLREFETLDLQEHARRFWSVVVEQMRDANGIHAGSQTAA